MPTNYIKEDVLTRHEKVKYYVSEFTAEEIVRLLCKEAELNNPSVRWDVEPIIDPGIDGRDAHCIGYKVISVSLSTVKIGE